MLRYKCPTCGKIYYPEKDEICPKCGDAAAPSVLTRIERKRTAERLRAEGKYHFDEHCHEDDAWRQSYGAGVHRAAVRSHEAALRANYAAHNAADNPTRVSNANSARTGANTGKAAPKAQPKPLHWIGIAWLIYVLYRVIGSILD